MFPMKRILSLLLILTILPLFSSIAENSAFQTFQAITNTKNVNVRKEPNKGSKLVVKLEKKNTKVTITDETYDSSGTLWYYVSTENGKQGYIRNDLLTPLLGSLTSVPELSFSIQPFPGGQKLAVYSAPSTKAWRGANGKAAVSSSGDIYVAGYQDGWVLVKYELDSGTTRIGYVQIKTIKGSYSQGEPLSFSSGAVYLESNANFYDDPDTRVSLISQISKGSIVTMLARYGDWAYVEYTVSGKQARGFIPLSSVDSFYVVSSTKTGGNSTSSTSVSVAGNPTSSGSLYGLAIDKLATRDGPGTQYTGKGTYSVKGQYIRILSRAWDSRNDIWWVKCEIPYRNEIRVLWTGYKRFDAASIPLSSIPIDSEYYSGTEPVVTAASTVVVTALPTAVPTSAPAPASTYVPATDSATVATNIPGIAATDAPALPDDTGATVWQSLYHDFLLTGQYRVARESTDDLDMYLDIFGNEYYLGDYGNLGFGLYDMNRDGIPELIANNGYPDGGFSAAHIYTVQGGRLVYLGSLANRAGGPSIVLDPTYPGILTCSGNNAYFATDYTVLQGMDLYTESVYDEDYNSDDGYLEEPVVAISPAFQNLYDVIKAGKVKYIAWYSDISEATWPEFAASAFTDWIGESAGENTTAQENTSEQGNTDVTGNTDPVIGAWHDPGMDDEWEIEYTVIDPDGVFVYVRRDVNGEYPDEVYYEPSYHWEKRGDSTYALVRAPWGTEEVYLYNYDASTDRLIDEDGNSYVREPDFSYVRPAALLNLLVSVSSLSGDTHAGNAITFKVELLNGAAPYTIDYVFLETGTASDGSTIYGYQEEGVIMVSESVWTITYTPHDPAMDVTFGVDVFSSDNGRTDVEGYSTEVKSVYSGEEVSQDNRESLMGTDSLDGYYLNDEDRGQYIPVTVSSDSSVYYAGVPIRFFADIQGGVPPFNVSWEVSELQNRTPGTPLDLYYETHSSDATSTTYVTSDRHVEFVYTPPVDSTTLFGIIYVTDANEIENYTNEDLAMVDPGVGQPEGYEDDEIGERNETGASDWNSAYRTFVSNQMYRTMMTTPTEIGLALAGGIENIDWFSFSLCDIDHNGIPELIVTAVYGIEQADIYTFSDGEVTHVGLMGGDNFFQYFFYFDDSQLPGLYAFIGGPGMDIERAYYNGDSFSRQTIGHTIVNSDGDDTIGIELYVDEPYLYQMLMDTHYAYDYPVVHLNWYSESELLNRNDWSGLVI